MCHLQKERSVSTPHALYVQLSGDCGSVSGVLVCWSLDLGSTLDRSLPFSFPLDCLSTQLSSFLAEYSSTPFDGEEAGLMTKTTWKMGYPWTVHGSS